MARRCAWEVEIVIERVEAGRADEVVDVLGEAFFDYPVMRFVLGDEGDYAQRQRRLVGLFVMARVLRGEPMLGVAGGSGLDAAAIVSRPDGGPSPLAFRALAEEVWDELGAEARARYEAYGAACAPFQVEEPHLHLNMIGVRERVRGTGLGRVLIDHVHEMSRLDAASAGVTLTTEDPRNVAMYRHLGYEIVGEGVVAPELRTWGFFRQD